MQYRILKNCFAGRAGYSMHADPASQKATRLLKHGFIEAMDAPKASEPKAAKREKKVIKPKERKA